jgi:hypothetical protein
MKAVCQRGYGSLKPSDETFGMVETFSSNKSLKFLTLYIPLPRSSMEVELNEEAMIHIVIINKVLKVLTWNAFTCRAQVSINDLIMKDLRPSYNMGDLLDQSHASEPLSRDDVSTLP